MTIAPRDPTKAQVTLVHVACVLMIIACILIKIFLTADYPELGSLLVGCATFLWGKLAFLPDASVLQNLFQALKPEDIRRLSMHPPALVQLTSQPAVILVNPQIPSTLPEALELNAEPVKEETGG